MQTAVLSRAFTGVQVSHDRTVRHNASYEEVVGRLTGRTVESVGRRGKFLLFELDDAFVMVAHLGMSGRFSVDEPTDKRLPHTHFVATMDNRVELRFIDPRTFGFVAVYDEDELTHSGLNRLGPDAWESPPSVGALLESLQGRTAPIKALLLDQRLMAGLGNIYADEALHRARISPLTPGGRLRRAELQRLLDAVAVVLQDAIERGGTTLEDLAYLLPDGRAGENLERLRVYARAGEPCLACGSEIQKTVVRARSTHYCAVCQPDV